MRLAGEHDSPMPSQRLIASTGCSGRSFLLSGKLGQDFDRKGGVKWVALSMWRQYLQMSKRFRPGRIYALRFGMTFRKAQAQTYQIPWSTIWDI
jgi:hypothetical protein